MLHPLIHLSSSFPLLLNMQDRSMQDNTVLDYVKNAVLLFPYKASEHKVEQILKYAHLTEAETTKINEYIILYHDHS